MTMDGVQITAPSMAPDDLGDRGAGRRVILVVEDEVIIRSVIAEYLRDGGFDVVEAASAAEAISIMTTQNDIDLLFSDVNMPGKMDGVALARWTRQHYANLPILLTSGGGAVPNVPGRFSKNDFLPKPYLPDALESRIREILAA